MRVISNTGPIVVDSDVVLTTADDDYGIFVAGPGGNPSATADITITSNEITTSGVFARGIYVEAGAVGVVTIQSERIQTSGQSASGFNILTRGGDIAITSNVVATTGSSADGIRALAREGGSIVIESQDVSVTGAFSRGIDAEARDGGDIRLDSVLVTASGSNSTGIRARANAGNVAITSGSVRGVDFGIIARAGGDLEIRILGSTLSQGTAIEAVAGGTMTIDVLSEGSVTGAEGLLVTSGGEASIRNAGSISGTGTDGIRLALGDAVEAGSFVVTNEAGASIDGNRFGIWVQGGTADVVNAGSIRGTDAAILFGAGDDRLTLRTGSSIEGLVEGGAGFDVLRLEGTVLGLTDTQLVSQMFGFERLDVASGYWSTTGFTGAFDSVVIDSGATLQVNDFVFGEGRFSPITTGAVTNNGRLVLNFNDTENLLDLDVIALDGSGSLELVGEGVFVTATGAIAATGGTTISNGGLVLAGTMAGDVTTQGEGFFQLGIGGTEGSFSGNLVNNGRFVFDRSDDFDFLGDFSGSGVLDKLGEGVLFFLGDYSFSGVTNIFGGSVQIGRTIGPDVEFNLGEGGTLDITGSDQTIAGLAGQPGSQVTLGEQTLTIDQNSNTVFAGTISGTGGIEKSGTGVLNLTGDSTYTGPTTINGGTLSVNGSIVSDVTVNSGGTLGGNGVVGSTIVAEGGTIAPGNSIGQLAVNGDLDLASGSIFAVEVNAAGQADRVNATGQVTIGATAQMAVLAENGTYAPRTDYVVLTGALGITGTFGSVTTDLAFLTPLLRYGANSVTLSLYRNDIAFAAVAANANQAGVATAVQSLGIDNPLFEAVLVQNAASARATFGDLSGELHASTLTGLTDDSRHLRNALLGMPVPQRSGLFAWGSVFGSSGEFDASADRFGMDTDHLGFVTGIGIGGDGFGVALSAGLADSDYALGGRSDAADISSKHLALHGSWATVGGLRGVIGLSYAWHEIDTARSVSGALAQQLTSRRDADTFQVFGEIGYEARLGGAAITPFARLAHVKTDSDGFTEAGGSGALVVAGAEQSATFLSLGARLEIGSPDSGLRPYGALAWNRVFGDRDGQTRSSFVAGGSAFTINGLPIPKDSAEIDAGLEYTTRRVSIGVSYNGIVAGDRNIHGGRITARLAF